MHVAIRMVDLDVKRRRKGVWARDEVVGRMLCISVLEPSIECGPFGKHKGEWPFVDRVSFEGVVMRKEGLGDGEQGCTVAVICGILAVRHRYFGLALAIYVICEKGREGIRENVVRTLCIRSSERYGTHRT